MSKHFWVVMRIEKLEDSAFGTLMGLEVKMVCNEEPFYYLPVFESREAAIEWNDGEDKGIFEMQEAEK